MEKGKVGWEDFNFKDFFGEGDVDGSESVLGVFEEECFLEGIVSVDGLRL